MQREQDDAKVANGRSKIYYWLAQFFLAKPTFNGLIQVLSPTLLEALEEILGEEQSIQRLKDSAKHLDQAKAEEVASEYDRLFKIPLPGRYIPPYESCFREGAYTDGAFRYGEMWGQTTMQVQEAYENNGFEPAVSDIPPDHIGLELLFMSKLCDLESQALTEKQNPDVKHWWKEQSKFLNEHLSTWTPDLADRIAKNSTNGFYSHIANIAKRFLQDDMDHLQTDGRIF